MAPLRARHRRGQARGPRANDRDTLGFDRPRDIAEFGLAAGGGIDHAGRELAGESVVQAGLIAANAHIDRGASPGPGLGDEVGIGQEGPCH